MTFFDMASIRRATETDRTRLVEVLHETFATTWLPEMTEVARARFEREDPPRAYIEQCWQDFWVAELSDDVAGFVHWQKNFLTALHVRPRHARRGIGMALMDKAELEIAASGFSSVRLETDTFNTASRAFYAKRGFKEVDRYPDREWNSGITTLLLEKPLHP